VFKKFLAALAALALALGISVVAMPLAASATQPDFICEDLDSGKINTSGDPATVTVTAPAGYLIDGYCVKAGTTKHFIEVDPPAAIVVVDHPTVTSVSHYSLSYVAASDSVDCNVITFIKGSALDGSNYINLTIIQDGKSFQMNAEINEVQAQDSDVAGPSGLYVLVKAPGGDVKYPLTVAERDSGVFRYSYSNYLTGKYTVDWIQYDGHNEHFEGELTCGEDVADAAASVTVVPPSCDAPGSLTLNAATFATWGAYTPATGPYSVVATAAAGHTFPTGNSAGITISADGKTKTFTGTIAEQKDANSEECADLAAPVAPTIVPVTACGTYGSVTPVAKTGVHYVTSFNSLTGAYTVTATPLTGFYFIDDQDGTNDQVITFSGNVGAYSACVDLPNASVAYGACVYDENAVAADRTATVTYDNTASNVAVAFSGIPGHDQTVPALTKVTFDLTVGPGGASYTVTAGSKTFPIQIDACDDYTKPKDDQRSVPSEKMICGPDNQVEITTVTYTTSYVFNPTTLVWEAQPEVAGQPVITYRDMTAEEKAENCGFTLDTDPKASQCDVVDGGTQLTSWIYVSPDPRVIYTITNGITTAVITPASGYVAVPPGKYYVTAEAAPGYVLNPTAPKTWPPYFVQDTTQCENTDLGLLTPTAKVNPPTCSSGATYTLAGLEGAQFNWTVNGAATTVPNGTYPAPANGADVVLIADPVAATDGLQDWTNPTTLSFDDVTPATCELTTLAFTGTGVSIQLTIAGVLIALAGLGFTAAGRRLREHV
jgi:hypothetical protein